METKYDGAVAFFYHDEDSGAIHTYGRRELENER